MGLCLADLETTCRSENIFDFWEHYRFCPINQTILTIVEAGSVLRMFDRTAGCDDLCVLRKSWARIWQGTMLVWVIIWEH